MSHQFFYFNLILIIKFILTIYFTIKNIIPLNVVIEKLIILVKLYRLLI